MKSSWAAINASSERAMGLDIGSGVIKFVCTSQSADRIDIHSVGSIPLQKGLVERGVVKDPQAMARTLRDQLQSNSVEIAPVTVSIPSSLAILRWINLPLLVGDELREAAKFKVKKHLPFPVDTAYVEASTPMPVPGEETGECLVIAVKREVIDSRAEAVESAGMPAIGAELEAQAILRVVERRLKERSPLWRDASLTILDVGASSTHMYVVQSQRLQFLRGVRFGSDGLSTVVASELGIDKVSAEAIIGDSSSELSLEGLIHLEQDGMPIRINVHEEVDRLTREFMRLLRYFRSLHPERSYRGILDHVLLCGGLASLRGFDEYLQASLGLRVERARPFSGMVGKFTKESFESISTRQEAYTVAMGLALSGLQGQSERRGDIRARHEFVWTRT
jgi:type IV pilus assembly protein PilM